ncbi:MAG: response regulator [Steroidobacteraceae bacterium]
MPAAGCGTHGMNSSPAARILVVDDDAVNLRALCETLGQRGYETEGAASGEQALMTLQRQPFDVLLTDLMMPGIDGVALLAAALKIDPQLAGILMTGKGTVETAVSAMQAGALDYVLKPVKLKTLLLVLSRAVSVRRLPFCSTKSLMRRSRNLLPKRSR